MSADLPELSIGTTSESVEVVAGEWEMAPLALTPSGVIATSDASISYAFDSDAFEINSFGNVNGKKPTSSPVTVTATLQPVENKYVVSETGASCTFTVTVTKPKATMTRTDGGAEFSKKIFDEGFDDPYEVTYDLPEGVELDTPVAADPEVVSATLTEGKTNSVTLRALGKQGDTTVAIKTKENDQYAVEQRNVRVIVYGADQPIQFSDYVKVSSTDGYGVARKTYSLQNVKLTGTKDGDTFSLGVSNLQEGATPTYFIDGRQGSGFREVRNPQDFAVVDDTGNVTVKGRDSDIYVNIEIPATEHYAALNIRMNVYPDILEQQISVPDVQEGALALQYNTEQQIGATTNAAYYGAKVAYAVSDEKDAAGEAAEEGSILTVDENGKLLAKGIGTAKVTLTAAAVDGPFALLSSTDPNYGLITPITTEAEPVVLDVTVSPAERTITVPENVSVAAGETVEIAATTNGDEEPATLVYKSKSPANATVDANGVVTGVAEGTATITVSAAATAHYAAATKEVTVAVGKSAAEIANQQAADPVIDAIAKLPEASAVTADDKGAADAAMAAYEALTDEQKALVGDDAKAKLDAVVKAASDAKDAADKKAAAEAKAKKVKSVTVNVKTVTTKAVKKAVAKKGGKLKYVTKVTLGKKAKTVKANAFKGMAALKQVVLGKNVKKLKKGAFKGASKLKTLAVKTKKLTKKSVKGSLKGSKVKTVQVKVGSKKLNKKYVKKYKKIFAKKVAGKKATVK